MRKALRNHKEVAHVWAQQTQLEGRASNMFFEHTTIYSYGHHFAIARIVPRANGCGEVVLFNSAKYSSSTAKHQHYTRRAVSHMTVFDVPSLGSKYEKIDHAANLKSYGQIINGLVHRSLRAVKYGAYYWQDAQKIAAEQNAYIDAFQLDQSAKIAPDRLLTENERAKIKARQDRQEAAERAAEERQAEEDKRRAAELLPKLEEWAAGAPVSMSYNFNVLPVRLRIHGDDVETSHGAYVTIDQAKRMIALIESGADVSGVQCGPYTASKIENGALYIGCHVIPLAEIHKIKEALSAAA